jgi:hypothetical protein
MILATKSKLPEIKDTDGEGRMVAVMLHHGRWKHLGSGGLWLAAGIMIGLHMDGWIGIAIAAALIGTGLWGLRRFVMSLINPAGTIFIRGDEIEIPPKLCAGTTVTMPISEVQNAYVLSHSVPFYLTAPVLVLETRRGVFEYPRDWFAREQDQRRVARTMNQRLERL